MAQKKETGTVASKKAAGKKSPPAKTGAAETKTKTKTKKDPLPEIQETVQPFFETNNRAGRAVGAFVCLFLAIFCLLGLFGFEAVFINFLCNLIKGLTGYGFYLMIPELLLCTVILFRHPDSSVKFRVSCALATPLAFGGLMHLFLCSARIEWRFAMLKTLFETGREVQSGGLISGFFAMLFQLIFSRVGAILLFLIFFVLLLLASFRITVISLSRAIQNRPRPEKPEAVPEQDPATRIVNHMAQKRIDAVERKRSNFASFDIPLDDVPEPVPGSSKAAKAAKKAGKLSEKELQEQISRSLQEPEPVKPISPDFEPEFMKKRTDPAKQEPTAQPSASFFAASAWQEDPDEPEAAPTVPEEKPEAWAPPVVTAPQPVQQEHGASMAPIVEEVARETEPEPEPEPETDPEPDLAEEPEVPAAQFELDGENIFETHPYSYPPVGLLGEAPPDGDVGTEEMRANAARLSDTLQSFGIEATITNVTRGPAVTRYELELDRGVKLSKLTNLSDDIALSLGASGVRIAAIPDRISVVGVEVPNKKIRTVYAREVLESPEFQKHKSQVAFAVGVNISGERIVGDITKLPHMLIAGTTGSGKSVCINTLIVSLLYRSSPEDVRLIMVDPKMIELGVYNGIPHLLIPVVTDPKKASGALQWAVQEMMRRYQLMAEEGARDMEAYNAIVLKKGGEKLPKIVIIIDELADLMMVAAKEVEESICRIAQLARAAGMHLIIATQRPSADVITGIMKANVPSRIAFAVASQIESRIILDATGAEKLVGKGDMLYAPIGGGKPMRVQGCFISDDEVENIVSYIKQTAQPDYSQDVLNQIEQKAAEQPAAGKPAAAAAAEPESDSDELLPAAVDVLLETGQASVSMLQRRLKLGYARAARIMDELEEQGIVGPFEGSKPRQMLITREEWQQRRGGGSTNDLPFDLE